MNQKGFSIVLILIGMLLVAGVLIGGAYYFGKSQSEKPEAVSTPNPVITPQATPSLSPKATSIIPLATAWSGKLNVYSTPTLGITFQYPAFFIAKEANIAAEKAQNNYYVSKNKDYEYESYGVTFSIPQLSDSQITDAEKSDPNFYSKYADNIMWFQFYQYDNPRNLSLYDFIADQYKIYAGGGREETFDTFKKNLNTTLIPLPNSYINVNSVSESPIKIVFFTSKGKIYEATLGGGLGTGQGYSDDANALFENMLKSIKFL